MRALVKFPKPVLIQLTLVSSKCNERQNVRYNGHIKIVFSNSDIFRGLRGPPKGLLLFGPPGTGKTLIGMCNYNRNYYITTFISHPSCMRVTRG